MEKYIWKKGLCYLNSKNPSILIVDDMEVNRAILCEIFRENYTILEAKTGKDAVDMLEANHKDIVIALLDIVMPEINGFDVLKIMNEKGWIKYIPVIMLSADDSDKSILKAYDLGAVDFIGRPFNPDIIRKRVENMIELYRHKQDLEAMVMKQTKKLKQANQVMVDTLSTIVEFRNGESGLHIRRVRGLTQILLAALSEMYSEYKISKEEMEEIANASALHDIGKIVVPENILNKPGKLTAEEFEIMKTHTVKGSEILKEIENTYEPRYFKYCYDICRHHHEKWDGRGYPDGLVGEDIPFCAQVVSVADVYDALTSERVYKKAFSHKKALNMILGGECGAFNPKLMRCLSEIESEIEGELKAIENNNFSIDMNLEKIMFTGTEEKTDIFSGKKNA